MTAKGHAPSSSSMEEVAAKRPEEVRPHATKTLPPETELQIPRGSPPQSALRADSSSIEEERGAKAWLRQRAKAMRTDMTQHEKAMWRLLHEGELVALNWRRQAVFGDFILDFVSHPARLVIEVDGGQHAEPAQAEHDIARTAYLSGEGYSVLRFWNSDVLQAADGVWRKIVEAADASNAKPRLDRWRAEHAAQIARNNARLASSIEEEQS